MKKRALTPEDVDTMLDLLRKLGTVGVGSENEARHWAEQVALGLPVTLEVRAERDGAVEIVYRRAS